MISSKLLWISLMTAIALVASISAENALASRIVLLDEEETAEAENATMMTANQTAANGNMTS